MAKKNKPAKAATKKPTPSKAVAKAAAKKPTLLTAAQIKEACPPEVEHWGNQIVGHYKTACKYESKADQQKNSIAQYLAKARAACNNGGFAAFHERFCPAIGRTEVYKLLEIGTGKKTVEEVKAETRERKARQRAKEKAEGKSSVTVTHEVKKQLIRSGKLSSNEVDPAASAEQRKIAYAKVAETEAKPEVKAVEPPVPAPTQEQALAAIDHLMTEARADGTFLTEEEFVALTKDELRGIFQLVSRFFCRLVRFPDEGRGIGFYIEEDDAVVPPVEASTALPTAWSVSDALTALLRSGRFSLRDLGDETPDAGGVLDLAKNLEDLAAELKRAAKSKAAKMPIVPPPIVPVPAEDVAAKEEGSNPAARDEPEAKSPAEPETKTKAKTKARTKDAKRIDWEASHPEEAKVKFLKQAAIENMSEEDLKDLKAQAKDDEMRWSDVKDEKIAQWVIDYWDSWEGSTKEEWVEQSFNARWIYEHGTPHPADVDANLLLAIKNANGPYALPDDDDEWDAAWRLEEAGHIKLDHDSGPKILATYIQHGEAD